MQYVQVNKSYVLDTKTNKLQPLSGLRGVGIDTPWWLWPGRTEETTLNIDGNAHHQVEAGKLHNLVIASKFNFMTHSGYASQVSSEPTSQTFIHPVIKFKNAKTGAVVQITVDMIAAVSGNDFEHPKPGLVDSIYPAIVAGITYNLVTSEGARRYTTQFTNSLSGFASIANLRHLEIFYDDAINRCYNLNFGLSERQFEVIYQGKPLEGTCYAYMLGTYAILLRDDFSFDSLAALTGCRDGVLKVERFMFSTNDLIKSLMGWG